MTRDGIKIIEALEQGSDAWHVERSKTLGSSELGVWLGGPAGRSRLVEGKTIVLEIGETPSCSESWAMRRGRELEPLAAAWLEEHLGLQLCKVGLVRNAKYPGLHSSPDRLVAGVWPPVAVEIKCPLPHNHKQQLDRWIETGHIDPQYNQQLRMHSAICGGPVIFCSFCPDADAQVLVWLDPVADTELVAVGAEFRAAMAAASGQGQALAAKAAKLEDHCRARNAAERQRALDCQAVARRSVLNNIAVMAAR